ncbi:MAG: hypothetical protein R3314_00485 [Longimicrobiales bacterium]|nr:hypothetical protein [Longimicrobiales bacterium]
MTRIAAPLVALLLATPITAQEWQVAREQFVYVGTRLTIDVDVDAAGTLRLIRGEPGSVRIASRAQRGFTSSGLADDDRLTLSAAGPGPVDYLVAVPENVWVSVRLPGRGLGQNVARGRTGSWEWETRDRSPGGISAPLPRPDARDPAPPPPTAGEPTPPTAPPGAPEGASRPASPVESAPDTGRAPESPLYTTFSRSLAPDQVSVPDLSVIERVSVRLEGPNFRVITSRPLAVEQGRKDRLEIRPAEPMELVLALPAGTASFTLRLGDYTALIVDAGSITTLCAPVTEQWLSNDRRWFTFNPQDGGLDCGSDSVRRHGG